MSNYTDFKDLAAYKNAFLQACMIYDYSQNFPKAEIYSLTDQIRRSSRSVCANLAEAYRKRAYIRHYNLKLTDCLGENSETLVWIDFANYCKYISTEQYERLANTNSEIGKLLTYMLNNPSKFGVTVES
jgi:four helix bundle protein